LAILPYWRSISGGTCSGGLGLIPNTGVHQNNKPTNTQRCEHCKVPPTKHVRSPFGELVHEFLGRDIGQIFGTDDVKRNIPHVNILERPDGFELQMMAPGYSKQDLKLSMEKEVLTISAERKKEDLKENERFTRREFMHSAFGRSFRLPDTVNAEVLQAEFTDGILRIRIPRAEATKPKTLEISIG